MALPDLDINPVYRVYSKDSWAAEWGDPVPHWVPQEVSLVAAPSISHATLKFDFGNIKREEAVEFAVADIPEKKARFIKIEVQTTFLGPWERMFIGYAPAENLKQFPFDGGGEDSGAWILTVYGLEYLLDNMTLDGAWCNPEQCVGDGSVALRITRTLAFNQKDAFGLLGVGNRSRDTWGSDRPSGAESYVFNLEYDPMDPPDEGDPDTTWNARNIAEYALVRFGATDDFTTGIEFTLGGQAEALENWQPPRLDLSGRTTRQVLNHLIDRRRGVGWCIRFDDDEQPVVQVFTAVADDVVVGDFVIPANAEAAGLDLSGNLRVKDPQLTTDLYTRFGRIEVHGAPVKVTFTVDFSADDQEGLTAGWKPAQETAYLAADDEARQADRHGPVYQLFAAGVDFDWRTKATVQMGDDGAVEVAGTSDIRRWGRVFARELTLFDDNKNLRKPFAVAKAFGASGDERYFYVEKPPKDAHGASLCMNDEGSSFEMRASGLNHVLARGVFDAAEEAARSDIAPVFDYRTLQATLCIASDTILSVKGTVDGGNPDRLLVIPMPHAETWVVKAGTVTDVDDDGALVTQAAGSVERDDSDKLNAILAMARAWYGFARSALSFGFDGVNINDLASVGALATTVKLGTSYNTCNTPCTLASWDCTKNTSHFAFGWDELDFAAIGGFKS